MGVDDVGPDGGDVLVGEPEPREAVVADGGGEDVAAGDQFAQHGPGLFALQVELNRALVTVDGQEDGPKVVWRAVRHVAGPAHDIAGRVLDLDHLAALVGQDLGGVCAEDHAGEIEDPHPG